MKNHVRRHVVLLCQALTTLSQRLPKPFNFHVSELLTQPRRATLPNYRLQHVFAQLYGLLPSQQWPRPGGQIQAAEACMIHAQVAARNQLPEDRLPLGFTQIPANPEGTDQMVPVVDDALTFHTAQYVDQIPYPETLAGAINARQCLLRSYGSIPGGCRMQTGVAIVTSSRGFLAKILP